MKSSRFVSRGLALSTSALALLVASSAFAQAAPEPPAVPEGTLKDAKATSGSTDITSTKATTMAKDDPEAKDATELSVQGGALVSTGNSKNLALTAGSKFRMRRAENQFSALLAANYGRGSIKGAKVDDTVGNIQGAARYDRFLGDLTLFAGLQARRDGFQGLNLRAQFDPGVGYYFVQEKTQQFWLEAGYDLLFDARTKSAIDLAAQKAPPQILSDTQTVHSARIFAGYELALETGFKLSAGLEFLQGLNETDIRRLNGTVQASAKVAEGLSMSLAFTGRYDSKPVVAENFDTVTTASLIYSFY
jgi:putative salt-induced outer membrane protein YdiY